MCCYENLPGVASALGFEVRRLPLRMEDGWRPNLEQLARLIDEKTRLIYLVHPHNPTGSTLQVEEMQAIARMAQRVGALVVNDEVFRLRRSGLLFANGIVCGHGFHSGRLEKALAKVDGLVWDGYRGHRDRELAQRPSARNFPFSPPYPTDEVPGVRLDHHHGVSAAENSGGKTVRNLSRVGVASSPCCWTAKAYLIEHSVGLLIQNSGYIT
ncbi:MAG: aminotransferase class I/II-fold pyridoxal phosphate-dependent enzyme [Ktedonobacteraceae bacterium]